MTIKHVIKNPLGPAKTLAVIALMASMFSAMPLQAQSNTSRDDKLKQVSGDIEYLASDELGGRQPGTPGMELAEAYIIKAYKEAGLKPISEEAGYVQPFEVGQKMAMVADSGSMSLTGPDGEVALELGKDFAPQNCRDSYDLNVDVVFVGYGIRADEHNFDEYADVEVEGKVVVMLRKEPQQDDPDSVFDGKENSQHAYIREKVTAARRAGAAAIILVNDGVTAPDAEQDELSASDQFGTQRIPFVQITRAALDSVLAKTPILKGDGAKLSSIADVEADIDRNLESLSQPMKGWKANLKCDFEMQGTIANNIVGIIEGEGPLKDEIIVIGGHHDHLGMGDYGSRAGRREIHNGADDNATGTVAVMDLARRFAARAEKPKRTLVFACFSAEEMGLLGAKHYVDNPILPMENTVAMINFDMIGWLRNKKVTIFGWNSSGAFEPVLNKANEAFELDLQLPPSVFAGSDHLPFYQNNVPVMFFHTGLTDTYHTPEDDFETLDCDGALTVIEYTEAVVDGLANLDSKPGFVAQGAGGNRRVRLGALFDDSNEKGVLITKVGDDSIAAKAGLQVDDVITEFGGEAVTKRREIVSIIRRKSGKKVTIKFLRGEEEMSVEAELKN